MREVDVIGVRVEMPSNNPIVLLREVGLVEQVAAPIRRGRDAGAQARAEEAVREIAALSVKLHATLVKSGLHSGR